MKHNFNKQHILILGIGIEGVSSAVFLKEQGARITLVDQKKEEDLDPTLLKQVKDLDMVIIYGSDGLVNLDSVTMIVRSPGVKPSHRLLVEAKEKAIPVTSQIKLFFDLCPCPIIGVTGTKGKGTTSSLIYEMLREQGFSAYLGGNIGKPPLTFLEQLTSSSWVVLELSSFQLQDLDQSPHIVVMLMVTSEHLDYHKGTYEYIDAKRNIVRFQKSSDFAIVNRDYPASNESDVHTHAQLFYVSRERAGRDGSFEKDGALWIKQGEKEEKIIDTRDILLPGRHNWENACAAAMAATLAGVSVEHIAYVLKTFKGLEHRLELVASVAGVRYYDDSFSTTPETAIAAIEAFTASEIVILGGSSKGSDFTQLGRVIEGARNIKAIIGIGVEWERIKSKFIIHNSEFRIIEGCKSMREIVIEASDLADPGDVVLLSPACASFDMFKNYKERGEQFKAEVKRLQISNF